MHDPRSEKLFQLIQTAYNSSELQATPVLKDLLFTAAQALENEKSYLDVIVPLSHGISSYYLKHHTIPKNVLSLYNQIKADVQPEKLNEKKLRQFELAKGLAAVPIMFSGIIR